MSVHDAADVQARGRLPSIPPHGGLRHGKLVFSICCLFEFEMLMFYAVLTLCLDTRDT